MAEDRDRRNLISYLEDRFGIPESSFDEYLMFERKRSWWLLSRTPHLASASSLKAYTFGMKAFQRVGRFVKPTTRMIQVFGPVARKAVIDISPENLHRLLEGEEIPHEERLEDGYVILTLHGQVLGLGLTIGGRARAQIRKSDLRSHRTSFPQGEETAPEE